MNHSDISQIQPKAWSILSRSFAAGRTASTYLFHGPNGLGHWPLAISFAALLNCQEPVLAEDYEFQVPCRKCRNCRSIFSLNFEGLYYAVPIRSHKNSDQMVDLTNEVLEKKRQEPFRLLASSSPVSIPIKLARDIKKALSLKGTAGVTRVVLFHKMERMKTSSADALLKMIEEPPADTVIILTAGNPEALLPTIQSRAQKIRLERSPEQPGRQYLQSKYGVNEDRARLVMRISQGNIGRAIAMIDDVEQDDESRRAVGFLLFKSLFIESKPSAVAMHLELLEANNKSAVEDLLALWQSLIRDGAYYASTGDEDGLVNIDLAPEIGKISRFFEDSRTTAHAVDEIKNTLADLSRNVHIQTALASLVLKLKSRLALSD